MYNMIYGYNKAVYLLAPMICETIPNVEFERFRNCFLSDDEKHILILTRTGGPNRKFYSESLKKIKEKKEYIGDRDYNEFDSTYLICEFDIPEEWEKDFQIITSGNLRPLSENYYQKAKKVYANIENDKPGIVKKLLSIGCSKNELKMKSKEKMMEIMEESAEMMAETPQIRKIFESLAK